MATIFTQAAITHFMPADIKLKMFLKLADFRVFQRGGTNNVNQTPAKKRDYFILILIKKPVTKNKGRAETKPAIFQFVTSTHQILRAGIVMDEQVSSILIPIIIQHSRCCESTLALQAISPEMSSLYASLNQVVLVLVLSSPSIMIGISITDPCTLVTSFTLLIQRKKMF